MSIRKIPLKTGYIYHIFNRGVNRQPIFRDLPDYRRFIATVKYYKYKLSGPRLSRFRELNLEEKKKILSKHEKRLISIIGYNLLPNHFHFTLRQEIDEGIKISWKRILGSYSRYFNLKYQRAGPLFQNRFMSVLIETEEQPIHLIRYIHLNPYTHSVVPSIERLLQYPRSSFRECLDNEIKEDYLCDDREIVLGKFKSIEKFKQFTLDQPEYQKKLKKVKDLIFD